MPHARRNLRSSLIIPYYRHRDCRPSSSPPPPPPPPLRQLPRGLISIITATAFVIAIVGIVIFVVVVPPPALLPAKKFFWSHLSTASVVRLMPAIKMQAVDAFERADSRGSNLSQSKDPHTMLCQNVVDLRRLCGLTEPLQVGAPCTCGTSRRFSRISSCTGETDISCCGFRQPSWTVRSCSRRLPEHAFGY